jgi:hypothetical protein
MKVLKEKINKRGKREVTVELAEGETLMAFDDNLHYRLGAQHEDVVAGHIITESAPVAWCSYTQEWVA